MFDWLKFLVGIIVIIVLIRFIIMSFATIYAVFGGCLQWKEYGYLRKPYCAEYKPFF
jgi:hypothetical protein